MPADPASAEPETDVLVIGGGPAGSLTAAILRRYNPELRVTLAERDAFPRYHIGESLVLEVNRVLEDAGALNLVEQAGFLRKGGATYVWGDTRRPWSFLFGESTGRRPHFEGARDYTWHVDRARFDQLLLDHAASLGVQVLQPARVGALLMEGERVVGAELGVGGSVRRVRARFVVDASGRAGVVSTRRGRRVFDPVLRNVATFGYFDGARLDPEYSLSWEEAAIAIVTIPGGWLWYIPMQAPGPDGRDGRGLVSVGVVVPAERYRELTGGDPEAFFARAVRSVPETARWLEGAELVRYPGAPRDVMVEQDFNYLGAPLWGPGWAAVGDAAGFVDPLFTFGVFLSATGAQVLAYVLGTLLDGRYAGATEERLLAAYERHMRGYFEAFTAMLYVFYGFNASKEHLWAETRELLRGHALPGGMEDRDAFMAFTFGYGVNTLLVHEATQHFGQVALRRIRDMCLDEERAPIELGEMGGYAVPSLPEEATPRLSLAFEVEPGVIPVAGTGRVVPMPRVVLASPGDGGAKARFPRYLYIPDELLFVLDALDGQTTVRSLLERVRRAGPVRSLRGSSPERFVEHVLRALSGIGALEGAAEGPTPADQRGTK